MTGAATPAIRCRGLIKRYGDVVAVAGLDLTVGRGECFGLLGPNGAGKTTTIRILLGLLRADSGTAQLLGGDSWHDAVALHRRLAYVPGDVELWPNLTGGQAIDLLARLFSVLAGLLVVGVALMLGRRTMRVNHLGFGIGLFGIALLGFIARPIAGDYFDPRAVELGRVLIGFTWRDDAVVGPLNAEQSVALAILAGVVIGLAVRGARGQRIVTAR